DIGFSSFFRHSGFDIRHSPPGVMAGIAAQGNLECVIQIARFLVAVKSLRETGEDVLCLEFLAKPVVGRSELLYFKRL
ncbi:MAG: hypothetical protein JWN70_6, partial [Planctomycetaceae bacterium]|nr:hypothetical protein [Planctomycetaceae bacterium]